MKRAPSPQPKVLLLDGDYPHTVAAARELKRTLGSRVLTLSRSAQSLGARSRHVDANIVAPRASAGDFPEALLAAVANEQPDVIVPIGYHSNRVAVDLVEQGQLSVPSTAPDAASFALAEDKTATYSAAADVGILAPEDLTQRVEESSSLQFPIVAKARHERGGSTARVIESHAQLVSHLGSRGDYPWIYQEMVNPKSPTFAHCGLFQDGSPVAEFQHAELRSVPRIGGSGTRLRAIRDEELATKARLLLRKVSWTGLAQVEFKRNEMGELAIMEINPKLWASYALASRAGAPLVTQAVLNALGLSTHPVAPYRQIEMAFPLREAQHVSRERAWSEIPGAAWAMCRPPVRWDLELRDLRGHIQSL